MCLLERHRCPEGSASLRFHRHSEVEDCSKPTPIQEVKLEDFITTSATRTSSTEKFLVSLSIFTSIKTCRTVRGCITLGSFGLYISSTWSSKNGHNGIGELCFSRSYFADVMTIQRQQQPSRMSRLVRLKKLVIGWGEVFVISSRDSATALSVDPITGLSAMGAIGCTRCTTTSLLSLPIFIQQQRNIDIPFCLLESPNIPSLPNSPDLHATRKKHVKHHRLDESPPFPQPPVLPFPIATVYRVQHQGTRRFFPAIGESGRAGGVE
jgi:hypothetical protein